jgi:steroid 5-alpha reductase family enzyme
MDALRACLFIYAGICLATWLLSVLTREYSWTDRIWSLAPIGYTGTFAGWSGFADARLDVMFVLVTLWGLRLTFNFARKGGYARGGEDYRWSVLRARMTPLRFQVFNLLFITLYQNAILLLISLPAYTALVHRSAFGAIDAALTVLFIAFLIGETVADQQQWTFQQRKRAAIDAGGEPARFLQSSLFRYSRHPNFFFEQAQWWALAAFGVVAAGSPQWTVLGAILLSLLFIGSTRFTESISLSRYPEYAHYQRRTSAVVPWWPRRGEADHTAAADPTTRP